MQIAIKTPQGTYVTLDPNDNSLHFDRTVIGPWETFDTSDPRFFVVLDAPPAAPTELAAPAALQAIPDVDARKIAILQWGERTYSLPPVASSLSPLLAVVQASGFPAARIADHHGQPSGDKFDFGDGWSADVIVASGTSAASWGYTKYATP